MPLVSQIVEADGKSLLDGGTCDSVPILYSLLTGAEKHIVVLTQASDYKKGPDKLMALMRQRYAAYPHYLERLQHRHYEYNRVYRMLPRLHDAGRAFVIRPPKPVTVASMEKDPEKLFALYEQGYAEAARACGPNSCAIWRPEAQGTGAPAVGPAAWARAPAPGPPRPSCRHGPRTRPAAPAG